MFNKCDMLNKVLNALTDKDPVVLASAFTDDCLYYDYCPSMNGGKNIYIYGRYSMELMSKKLFVSGDLEVSEPLIESDTSASFFGAYGGPYVFARINIEEFGDDGRIKKAVVHPA